VIFLLKYHQKPQETEHRKKEKTERKHIKKEKRKKRKSSRVSSNKWEVNILREEKYFNFKILFLI
jgi:hypothetical protein